MSSPTPTQPVAVQTPIVASPTLLSRIEALIATVEASAKADVSRIYTAASDIPKVETAATKYWMAIAGVVAGLILEHVLRLIF